MAKLILLTIIFSLVACVLTPAAIYIFLGCFPSWYWASSEYIFYFILVGLIGLVYIGRLSISVNGNNTNIYFLWGRSLLVVSVTFSCVYYLLVTYLASIVVMPFSPNTC
jgi:hypothetical protein